MNKLGLNQLPDRLAALGEDTRLRVLCLLEHQELAVGEVAKIIQKPQSNASRLLKTLQDAGWVTSRSEGTATLFRMSMDDLAAPLRGVWAAIRDNAVPKDLRHEDGARMKRVLAERRLDSQSFFGRHGGDWDGMRETLFGPRLTGTPLLGLLRPEWVVADLGCGSGHTAELIAPHVQRVICVDFLQSMLDRARERLAAANNCEFMLAGVEATKLPPRCADVAMLSLVLHHIEAPRNALAEAARLLRTSRGAGTLIVVEMVSHGREDYRRMGHKHLGFTQEQIETMMREAGLQSVRYAELAREPDAKGPGLFIATGQAPTIDQEPTP